MADFTTMKVLSAETLALSTSSRTSAPIGDGTNPSNGAGVVRLVSDVAVWVAFAATVGVGAPGALLLPAGVVEYFDVPAGGVVSAILSAGVGSLSIARMVK